MRAIELRTGRIAWELPLDGPARTWSGALATAGGLVFFGDDNGDFAAVDAHTGEQALGFPGKPVLEILADDLHGGRPAVCRHVGRYLGGGLRTAGKHLAVMPLHPLQETM